MKFPSRRKEELRALNIKEEKKYETSVVPTFEPMPKWMLLEEVIQEIREDASDRKLPKDDQRIVVAAKDEAAVRVLEMLLVHGSEKVSNAKWEDFLKSRVGRASTAAKVQEQQLQQQHAGGRGRRRQRREFLLRVVRSRQRRSKRRTRFRTWNRSRRARHGV